MNALERCFEANKLLRSIIARAHDAVSAFTFASEDAAYPSVQYAQQEFRALKRLWPIPDSQHLKALEVAVNEGTSDSMHQASEEIASLLGDEFDSYTHSLQMSQSTEVLEGLLHPLIIGSSYAQFKDGHYRDAVLNSVVAIFDFIRKRTGIDKDGLNLVGSVFSLEHPMLIFSTLDTDSGQSDQKGFMQILIGAYIGIRNPKAHSLSTDLNERNAAQYLVFASLLARRVDEALAVKAKKTEP